MIIKADLHLHSCASPCGDLSMSPSQIVKTLKENNILLAALTDHNTSLNCDAFAKCCQKEGIAPLFGMEGQTQEEIHVLCLFSELDVANDFCTQWYNSLPNIKNKPDVSGDQVYVNENDEIIGEIEKYLILSSPTSIDDIAEKVHSYGGIVIPAHVDRPAFSMTSQLGAIVESRWDALEFVKPEMASNLLPSPYPVTTSSDAHYIEHIGRRAFELDIEDEKLFTESGITNLLAIRKGLEKLVIHP